MKTCKLMCELYVVNTQQCEVIDCLSVCKRKRDNWYCCKWTKRL